MGDHSNNGRGQHPHHSYSRSPRLNDERARAREARGAAHPAPVPFLTSGTNPLEILDEGAVLLDPPSNDSLLQGFGSGRAAGSTHTHHVTRSLVQREDPRGYAGEMILFAAHMIRHTMLVCITVPLYYMIQ